MPEAVKVNRFNPNAIRQTKSLNDAVEMNRIAIH
jgi:hypothetical protein